MTERAAAPADAFMDQAAQLIAQHGARLQALAFASIQHGVEFGKPLPVDLAAFPEAVHRHRACSVTLHLDADIRGTAGEPAAWRPLALAVSQNAFAAAFNDPLFPPLRPAERARLQVTVALLGPPEPIAAADEAALLAALRPGDDALLLREGERFAMFLPEVWATLPDPRDFVTQLKRKAGLAPEHWSSRLGFARFAVCSTPAADIGTLVGEA